MIRLFFKRLFCNHDYEVIDDFKFNYESEFFVKPRRLIIQRCKKCGNIHKDRINLY